MTNTVCYCFKTNNCLWRNAL